MRSLIFVALALLSTSVLATEQQKPLAVDAITAQQTEIRAEVQAGTGRYQSMPQSTRDELLAKQAELLAILHGKTNANELTEAQKQQVFNSLEWITATINNSPDDRMVCRTEHTIGSNMPKRVCRTAARMREEQERAREELERGNNQVGR